MNETPRSERLHIAVFGLRNAGKSSLVNAIAGQEVSLVSPVPGTTTDPVSKAMELLPLGPVVLVDTAGIDDDGDLGRLRAERAVSMMDRADVVVLVVDPFRGISDWEQSIARLAAARSLPLIAALNKVDLLQADQAVRAAREASERLGKSVVPVSARSGAGIGALKEAVIRAVPDNWAGPPIVADLLKEGDVAVLVTPIDKSAPRGRLILPQVQVIREVIEHGSFAFVTSGEDLPSTLEALRREPRIVITDSQAFAKVARAVPAGAPLTSFSILLARQKGDLPAMVDAARFVDRLQPGDRVLVAEACTHHRFEDDIGRVKIPRMLERRVGGPLSFGFCSGWNYPTDLAEYRLVVHCGGCMINRREMISRIRQARGKGVPITNYGVILAHLNGILDRVTAPLMQ
ncbi:MAG: [FeFe] hydrogenase H-cluster maturation GTPase HydF [Bacillota bacterium]